MQPSESLQMSETGNRVCIITLLHLAAVVCLLLNRSMWLYIFVAFIFAGSVVSLFVENRLKDIRIGPAFGVSTLMFVHALIITIISPYRIDKINSCAKIALLFMFFVLGMVYRKRKELNYLSRGLIQISDLTVVLSIIGLLMHLLFRVQLGTASAASGQENMQLFSRLMPVNNPLNTRMRSLYNHPIIYADMVLLALYIELSLRRDSDYSFFRTAILLLGLFLSQTRSAWISLPILLAAYCFSKSRVRVGLDKVILVLIPLFAVAFISMTSIGLADAIVDKFHMFNTDASFSQRIGAIEYMVKLMSGNQLSALLGSGYGSSSVEISNVTIVIDGFTTVDNGWLSMVFDFGLLFSAVFVTAVFRLIKRGLRTYSAEYAAIAIGVILLCFLNMCFYDMLSWYAPASVFFFSLGFLFSNEQDDEVLQ